MDKLDIILWAVGGGFIVVLGVLRVIWNAIIKLDEKITDIDRRLCRLEGAFSAKDCCVIKDERQIRKETG